MTLVGPAGVSRSGWVSSRRNLGGALLGRGTIGPRADSAAACVDEACRAGAGPSPKGQELSAELLPGKPPPCMVLSELWRECDSTASKRCTRERPVCEIGWIHAVAPP